METQSLWKTFSDMSYYPPLTADLTVDVAIIGGGMCGLSCAQLLTESGFKVAVLEAAKFGESNTGNSTGNLYSVYGELLRKTRNYFDVETVSRMVSSRIEAIGLIEGNINRFGIDCDFKRVPWFYFSSNPEADSNIEKSRKTLEELEFKFEFGTFTDQRLRPRQAIRIDTGAAQFNPMRYIQGLARAIRGERCLLFEESKVEEIHEGEVKELITARGKVRASHVIHATHTPKGFMPLHAMLGPYREYGIACKIEDPQHPEGIYFGYYDASEITSIRHYERDGEHFLIVVGEPHKVGQGDSNFHIRKLEEFANDHYKVREVTHRWGGQHYKPADHVPYIGRRSKGGDTFIATGFSTHGLVYATVAAQLISDLIRGKENPYTDIYDPGRFTPFKSAPKFIEENVNVFTQMVKDYLGKKDQRPFADIAPGEGQVVEHEGHKMAVYKTEDKKIQVCSAICTHMGCVVHWNNAETSWDCPCHGSRFATDGEVIEGPALKALARMEELTDNSFQRSLRTLEENLFMDPGPRPQGNS